MKKLICHCGEVEAEINLDGDLVKVLQCNCSICKRKNAFISMVKNEDFKIVKGEDKLKLYQFHSHLFFHPCEQFQSLDIKQQIHVAAYPLRFLRCQQIIFS